MFISVCVCVCVVVVSLSVCVVVRLAVVCVSVSVCFSARRAVSCERGNGGNGVKCLRAISEFLTDELLFWRDFNLDFNSLQKG